MAHFLGLPNLLYMQVTDQLEACAWEWCLAHSCRPASVSDLGRALSDSLTLLCNYGGHNALYKSTLIFKWPCIVVWFGNLPPPFLLTRAIWGVKKVLGPSKVSILYRDHLESLNWPHLVIWQGTPHLQHRCINIYYLQPYHQARYSISSILRNLAHCVGSVLYILLITSQLWLWDIRFRLYQGQMWPGGAWGRQSKVT
jgi:hypothetical protein